MEINFVVFMCTVCGETIKYPYPSTYSPNIAHNHIDENGQEYHILMIQVYPPKEKVIAEVIK